MKKIQFKSYDGKELACFLWDDVKEPKGVIQILHGMTSHMMRYDELGKEFNRYGYIAFGDDHRPHGATAGMENLGKAGINNFNENMLDEIAITRMLKAKYNLPVQLFAHSYGSFLAQAYLEQEESLLDGVILSGSAHMGGAKLAFGKVLTFLQRAVYRMDEPNLMLFNMTFVANNKPFLADKVDNAWLNRDMEKVALYNSDPYCNFIMTHGFYYSMMRSLSKVYKKNAMLKIRKDLPIFIISGSLDPLGGRGKKVIKLYDAYKGLGLNVRMKLYEGARHELTSDIEKDTVIKEMTEFFDSNIKSK
ncbi:MAG: alpha/beta hydrolase [Clostridia bacterium]|nr:alpha/beta hydrolase [Clostridia bacterium]